MNCYFKNENHGKVDENQVNICTLLTKDYLIQGLALYNSLKKNTSAFLLWILCVDDIAYKLLNRMNLDNVVLVGLDNIIDKKLAKVQQHRQIHEFCWTIKASFIRYLFKNNCHLDSLLYMDGDMFFFKDVRGIYEEWEDYSIFITKLWLGPRWQKRVGIYSSGLIGFKRDKIGKMCLRSWHKNCLNWCYDRQENGLWGDQKYLDQWPQTFSGVEISKNKGINLGPWNVNRGHKFVAEDGTIYFEDHELICYHFSGFKIVDEMEYELCNRKKISAKGWNIYSIYVDEIRKVIAHIKSVDNSFMDSITGKKHLKYFNHYFVAESKE